MQEQVFQIENGFLPVEDPIKNLPQACAAWETFTLNLPKYLVTDQFKSLLLALPPFPLEALSTSAQYERAMLLLSYLGHAYVWGEAKTPTLIPEHLAKPWCAVAKALNRPPVLSYASYALYNWYRIDPEKPAVLGNIALLQNFLGGVDEEWFILVHVDIEARAGEAIQALQPLLQSAKEKNAEKTATGLKKLAKVLLALCTTLDRMPERCDPYVYYNRVRPYIHGWKNNPALPQGLIYENCFNNEPQFFRGETGAQSSIIPALDTVLGITHQEDELSVYLQEMRDYMPLPHQAFLNALAKETSLRSFVQQESARFPALRDAYNDCVELLVRFRMTHLRYAAIYIHKQSQHAATNSTAVGTGGTPFMRYLKKHEDETAAFKI